MADPIASWQVEIDGSAIQSLRQSFAEVQNEMKSLHREWTASVQTLSSAYGTLKNSVMGYVQAGLSGTVQGNQLAISMQFLSREIASIFTPTINAAIKSIHQLVDVFRGLSGGQQETIRNTVLMAGGYLGFVAVVRPLIISLYELRKAMVMLAVTNPLLAVAAAFGGLLMGSEDGRRSLMELGKAFAPLVQAAGDVANAFAPIAKVVAEIASAMAEALTPFISQLAVLISKLAPFIAALYAVRLAILAVNAAAWMNPFVLIAGAIAGVVVGAIAIRNAMTDVGKGAKREDVTLAGKGFESFEATWLRLQESINKTDYAKQQTDLLGKIEQNTRGEKAKTLVQGASGVGNLMLEFIDGRAWTAIGQWLAE